MRGISSLLFLGICALFDADRGKVPNIIMEIQMLLIGGILIPYRAGGNIAAAGPLVVSVLMEMAAALLVLLPFYRLSMVGAADVKALVLLAGTAGLLPGMRIAAAGLLIAAVRGTYLLWHRHIARERALYFAGYLERAYRCLRDGDAPPAYYVRERDGDAPAMRLMPCFFLGAAALCVFQGGGI